MQWILEPTGPVMHILCSMVTDSGSGDTMETECNVCGGNIAIQNDAIQGEIVGCPDCGLEYEIQSLENNTVLLRAAEEIREDWGE